jgi:hypothetical protein
LTTLAEHHFAGLARRVAKPRELVRPQTGDAPERTLAALVGRRMYGQELGSVAYPPNANGPW